jgi:hypothetical protein
MNLRWIPAIVGPATAAALALAAGCGTTSAPDPFTVDAGVGGSGGGGGAGGGVTAPPDAGVDSGLILGGPCLDDGQCNDMIDCTFDTCDTTLGRCLIIPDDSKCQDGIYCDGVEICDPTHGCVAGDPVTCDTGDECVIATCVEATQSCSYTKLDADGDGDPDAHCGGKDCNDHDPNVSSLHVEVCANGIDDNCNGIIDEMPCSSPEHATCLDPLQISASGTYAMTTVGATFSYPTSCGVGNMTGAADVVAAVLLPAGPLVDIEATVTTSAAPVSVAIAGQCGDPSTELACGAAFQSPQGGEVARARARGVGSATQATAFPVYVSTAPGSAVALEVQILPATTAPANQSCGTAAPITPGVPVAVEILDEAQNLGSACATQLGSLVYSFTLAAPSDVDVYAISTDGDGAPMISLRDAGCSLPTDEIACIESTPAHLYRQAVAAGTYYVALSASAPTTAELTVELSAPTTPAPDQSCTGAPVITPNVTIPVTLSTHEDDIDLGCDPGAVDAAYELDLPVASDVLLVERIAQNDTGAVGLALPACTQATALACQTGTQSPVRTSQRNVPAGSYRAVAESLLAEDVQLTAFVRAAVPPTLVVWPLGDGCADAFAIPPQGGFFQGNTANATANFPAGCDEGGVAGNGAPDQLLSLTLTTTQRVILDMEGSGYNTILDVRQGPACPGTEIPMACAAGYGPQRSYLDLTLAPGLYYLQVDGFDLAKGPWFLDVRVVDP